MISAKDVKTILRIKDSKMSDQDLEAYIRGIQELF